MESSTSVGHSPGLDGTAGHGVDGATADGANGQRWRQVFAGEERQLAHLRRWLASLLPPCEARDDVVSIATELGSNAIRHTGTGRGGKFAVEITWSQRFVRVAVADGGGPAGPRVIDAPTEEHGRGLLLVRGLSARMGVAGDQRGRLVWADVAWDGLSAASASVPDHDEAAIRAGEAALARRFAGVTTWFGRSTLAWWALVGSGELVTAPSASELASLLDRFLGAPSWQRDGTARGVSPGCGPRPGGTATDMESAPASNWASC
jgi:serine/threonine-protein kinase RsbW